MGLTRRNPAVPLAVNPFSLSIVSRPSFQQKGLPCERSFDSRCPAATSAVAQPSSQQPFFNVITLETSATADVPTDTLTVTLFTEEQGPIPGRSPLA
jgi:hypothetical protein